LRLIPAVWAVVCLLLAAAFAATPVRASTPQRIISMSPSITESLFALGAGNRVVGVTDFCSWPEEACRLPSVGGMLNPSIETWITLKPDLIILQVTSTGLLKNAQNLGIPTLQVDMSRVESIFSSFRKLGEVLQLQDEAQSLVNRIQSDIDDIRNRLKTVPAKSTLLILGDSADPARDLYAVGPDTFLGELLRLAGGTNILQDPLAQYPRISKEFIISQSPEVIIEAGPKFNLGPEQKAQRMKDWAAFPSIRAVQTHQIHFIGADYILIPGPRLTHVLQHFAHAIHPTEIPAPDSEIGVRP
jgi:iron complex transport system substrate-binding protein